VLAVFAVALGLALIEVISGLALRAFPEPATPARSAADPEWLVHAKSGFKHGFYVEDPDVLWMPKPGRTERGGGKWGDGLTINANGHRSQKMPAEKPEGVRRIMVLGGSHPFGMWVGQQEVYSAVMQSALDARQPGAWQVMNAACPGHTTYQGRAYLEKFGARFAPDIVVFDLGMNDQLPLALDWAAPDHEVAAVPASARAVSAAFDRLATFHVLKRVLRAARPATTDGVRVPLKKRMQNLRTVGKLGARLGWKTLYVTQVGVESVGRGKARCTYRAEGFEPKVDLCAVFEAMGDEAGAVFVDPIHADARGHRIIGDAVLARLDELGWTKP
jgi:lysophospholipase L1-like esterase